MRHARQAGTRDVGFSNLSAGSVASGRLFAEYE
jgi:hypothetical protein